MKCTFILSSSLYTLSVFIPSFIAVQAQALPPTLPPSPMRETITQELPTPLVKARDAFEKQQYAQARDLLLAQLESPPVAPGTYSLLSKTYLALDQKIQALNTLQQGLSDALTSPEEKLNLYLQKHSLTEPKPQDIETINTIVLNEQPSAGMLDAFSRFLESEHSAIYVEGFFAGAKQRLESALDAESTLEQLKLLKALDALQPALDDITQRRYRFLLEDLWEVHPNAQVVRSYVVKQYLKNKAYEDLLAFYRRELQLFASEWSASEKSVAFQHIADLHFKLGYLSFAYRNYEVAVKQDPTNQEALLRQGMTDLAQQNFSPAQKVFKSIFQKDPLNIENRYLLALCYFYQKEKTAGEQVLQGLSASPPDYLKDLLDLAQISPGVPPRLWEVLTSAPDFLNHI